MDQGGTRFRLLKAAGEIISRKGFRAATVREICARAGANVASVKYYFGGKKRLYEELLRYSFEESLRNYPPDPGLPADASPTDRLRAFIRSYLMRLHDEGRSSWFGKLMTREMFEPTEALDQIVEQAIRPLALMLRELVRQLAGAELNAGEVLLCGVSIAAQCQHFYRARAVVTRVYPELRLDRQGIEDLTDHILAFSLAAIRGYKRA
jgi:AcrR family transcriptional regulator